MTVRQERGAATVLVATFIGVLLLLGAALGYVAALVITHRQAQSGADLAALAAATAVQHGRDGCAAGAEVAAANDVRLTDCVIEGETAHVTVTATGPQWREWSHDLTAQARAGPVARDATMIGDDHDPDHRRH